MKDLAGITDERMEELTKHISASIAKVATNTSKAYTTDLLVIQEVSQFAQSANELMYIIIATRMLFLNKSRKDASKK